MRIGVVAALGAVVMLCGCASVTRGTDEPVTFDSDPPGAQMRSEIINPCGSDKCPTTDERYAIADKENKPGPACVTPCTVQIRRADELLVTFSKEGYQPQTVTLEHTPTPGGGAGFAGNVLLGGAVGMVTDSVTYAAYDHAPNPLKVTLVPIAKPAAPARTPIKRR